MRRLNLTARDLGVLACVASFRFATPAQLAALHFRSARAGIERLRRLAHGKLLAKAYAQIAVSSRRSEFAYTLTRAGARVLEARLGVEVPRHQTRPDAKSALMLHHTLRRNDIRVAFERLSDEGLAQLAWRQDPNEVAITGERRRPKGRSRRVRAIPDGIVNVWHRDGCEVLLVEADRASVAASRMVDRYHVYAERGLAHLGGAGGDVTLRVLTVTPSRARMLRLIEAAREATDGSPKDQFLFTTYEDLIDLDDASALLRPVWWSARAGATGPIALFPQLV